MHVKGRTRVEGHTRPELSARIARESERRVDDYRHASDGDIRARLRALDAEWDVERALEASAASAVLSSLLLGRTAHRGFYALAGVVGGFLLQHALQGWCPPLELFRRAGFRTQREIELERSRLSRLVRERESSPSA